MANTYDAGVVTAYGAAVRGGYTGTYEEFCAQQAEYADNAAAVEQAVSDAEASATAAAASATAAATSETNAATSETNAATSETNAAASATAAATSEANAATSETNAAASEAAAETAQAAAEAVLASIPEDYTELSEAIDEVKSDKVDTDLMQKCEIVEVEASANLWDADSVTTGLLHTNGTVYTGGSYDTYCYYDIGEVSEGDVLTSYKYSSGTVSTEPMQRVVAYDSNGDVVSASSSVSVTTYTVPSGVASIKVTVTTAISDAYFMVFNNAESAPTEYIAYHEAYSYYVATADFIPDSATEEFVTIDGEDQVTAKNSAYMFYSPNLVDESALTSGYYVNQTTGVLGAASAHSTTDWISVTGGSSYTFSCTSSRNFRYCWYDSDKTFISGAYSDSITSLTVTAPSSASYCRFSTTSFATAYIQFEEGSTATSYSEYGTAYLLPEYAPQNDSATINLPSAIYALTDYELNIYFENLVENWTKYSWNVTCSVGMQLERGFRITPTDDDAGSYTLTITATDDTGTITTASTTLIVTAASAGSGTTTTLIVLGDSTTNNGQAVTDLYTNMSDDVMGLILYGTRGTSPYLHEGRSGWTFAYYFTLSEDSADSSVENPFYNPDDATFDASYYFTNSGVSVPDWFFINLGINDTFSYTDDDSLATQIDACVAYCDSMIESIQTADSSIKIGVCLTIPPNHSQDAFGKAYDCGQTRDRYKRNNMLWVNELISQYDNRTDEGIYLVPIYASLDTVYNMGLETDYVNARNTDVTYQSPIANGGVHPASTGYYQIADVYTAFLKGNA